MGGDIIKLGSSEELKLYADLKLKMGEITLAQMIELFEGNDTDYEEIEI